MVVQPVIEAQVRSVVTPGAVAWYCVEVHVVRLVHARLLVVVALAVASARPAEGGVGGC